MLIAVVPLWWKTKRILGGFFDDSIRLPDYSEVNIRSLEVQSLFPTQSRSIQVPPDGYGAFG